MKKVLKGTLIVILLIIGSIGLILVKEYIESKRKTYKIEYDKVKRNPMGGISVHLIINDDPEMMLNTTLEKGTQGKKYETGAKGISPKLGDFVYGERR